MDISEKDLEDFKEAEDIIEQEGSSNQHWTVHTDTFKPGKDKILHFLACLIITVVTYFIGGSFGYAMLGLLIALVAGYLKELYDLYIKKTKFDWKDIAWDTFGAFAGVLVSALIYIITH